MGNYLTTARIEARVTSALLEGFTGKTGTDLTTELTTLITQKENIIEGYCGGHYDVPLTSDEGKAMAEEWTFILCLYDLHMRGYGGDVQVKVRLQFEDVMRQLRDVAAGKLTIPGEEPPSDSTMGLYIESHDAKFDWEGDAEDTY